MIVIGAIVTALAVTVIGAFVAGGASAAQVDFGKFALTSNAAVFFFVGMLVTVGLIAGLWLITAGADRWRAQRRELDELRARAAAGELSTESAADAEPNPESPATLPSRRLSTLSTSNGAGRSVDRRTAARLDPTDEADDPYDDTDQAPDYVDDPDRGYRGGSTEPTRARSSLAARRIFVPQQNRGPQDNRPEGGPLDRRGS